MALYYRKFCPDFSTVAKPITDLWKKDVKFHWGPSQQKAFDNIKRLLTTPPCLAHFNPGLLLIIHCDASGYGIRGVLVQVENGKEQPLVYASMTFTDIETRYSTTERECLALVYATHKFRPYLF